MYASTEKIRACDGSPGALGWSPRPPALLLFLVGLVARWRSLPAVGRSVHTALQQHQEGRGQAPSAPAGLRSGLAGTPALAGSSQAQTRNQ
jgi:hypothetical protein